MGYFENTKTKTYVINISLELYNTLKKKYENENEPFPY